MPDPCTNACVDLYQCGLENDNCPGFAMVTQQEFVAGCLVTCEASPALVALVDANDCATTIMTISSLSKDFAAGCNGAPN